MEGNIPMYMKPEHDMRKKNIKNKLPDKISTQGSSVNFYQLCMNKN